MGPLKVIFEETSQSTKEQIVTIMQELVQTIKVDIQS